jgi:hypothetical protein
VKEHCACHISDHVPKYMLPFERQHAADSNVRVLPSIHEGGVGLRLPVAQGAKDLYRCIQHSSDRRPNECESTAFVSLLNNCSLDATGKSIK